MDISAAREGVEALGLLPVLYINIKVVYVLYNNYRSLINVLYVTYTVTYTGILEIGLDSNFV